MRVRIQKSIERMLCRAIPSAPTGIKQNWFARAHQVRFYCHNHRTALRRARQLEQEAKPLLKGPALLAWLNA